MRNITNGAFLCVILAFAMLSCFDTPRGNANDPKSSDFNVSAVISPENGYVIDSTLIANTRIVITFSQSMQTDTVTVTGDVVAANLSSEETWSQTSFENDTLTINLANKNILKYNSGPNTLYVNGIDKYGKTMPETSVTFTMLYSVAAGISPASGTTIAAHEPLIISFSIPMDKTSVTVSETNSGTTKSYSSSNSTQTWSYDAKTLTISMTGTTPYIATGSTTITVNGTAAYGYTLTAMTASYTVDRIVYVHPSGDDNYAGTSKYPVATIAKGISLANTIYSGNTSKVCVAMGNYTTNWGANTNKITMLSGISLYGGYSSSDWNVTRSATTYPTIVSDQSTTTGSTASPNRTIDCGTSVPSTTILDGFTIYAGNGGSNSISAAVFCSSSSLTIQNCVIDGGTGADKTIGLYNYNDGTSGITTNPTITSNTIRGGTPITTGTYNYSFGIYNYGTSASSCAPIIKNNSLIYGGDGLKSYGIYNYISNAKIYANLIEGGTKSSKSTTTYGIYIQSASPPIINNVIYGGNGSATIDALYIYLASSPKIYNNTIDGGSNSTSTRLTCIYISGSSTTNNTISIENNILYFSSATNLLGYGIYEANAYSDPLYIKNNNISNTNTSTVQKTYLYYDNDTSTGMFGINSGNFVASFDGSGTALTNPTGVNNISTNPLFLSTGDGYHLSSSTPSTVTQGGLDLSSDTDFPTDSNGYYIDKDGNKRSGAWSIGAYQY